MTRLCVLNSQQPTIECVSKRETVSKKVRVVSLAFSTEQSLVDSYLAPSV
jgi:hypothetical protein